MGESPPGDSQVDQSVLRVFNTLFTRANPSLERAFDVEHSSTVDPTSSLASDDKALGDLATSSTVTSMLLAAADHLDALRSMLFEAKVLYIRAPYTLLRCALENASVAVWLLAPSNRDERIIRRLRWEWANIVDQYAAFELIKHTPVRSKDDRRMHLLALARTRGLSDDQVSAIAGRTIGFGQIVDLAAEENALLDKATNRVLWSMCSGISHGRQWPVLPLSEHSRVAPIDDKRVWVRLSISEKELLDIADVTLLTFQQGWHLFDQRRRGHGL
ncbi:hypothetical protein [Umezawaea sp. Da 62-37]|uniref:hypothetical protein n=1 Tax=Umezawaea sp. Da 62-37 TaxID=3075927 RepID=UPI0028F6CE33|nr:hypothetical protein [Umezawaea sp. Da 62-37]WNV84715.1 hypothetical protein RM788_42225 [Umezawaea sp. Da 62-37]